MYIVVPLAAAAAPLHYHAPCVSPGAAPPQILICQNLRNNLQHPNEYIRGVTLRFLCRIREEEILEPLVPSILANLEHRWGAAAAVLVPAMQWCCGGRQQRDAVESMCMWGWGWAGAPHTGQPGAQVRLGAEMLVCWCVGEMLVCWCVGEAGSGAASSQWS